MNQNDTPAKVALIDGLGPTPPLPPADAGRLLDPEQRADVMLRAKVSHFVAPYVVVSNPGTLFERIEDYCSTLKGAIECKSCYDDPCDVMRVLPSGRLTTEF